MAPERKACYSFGMLPYIDIGGLRVEPYGLLIVLGTTLGILWLWHKRDYARAPEETAAQFWLLVYVIVFGGVVGGKLGYILVEWEWFLADPLRVLLDWRSGWVFWFSVLGSILAGYLFQQWHNRGLEKKRAYLPVADYIVAALPLGHWLGRLACFAQGCCHGRPTELPWGVVFTHPACNVPDRLLGVALHPTQLYESAAELSLAAFLILRVIPMIERGRWRYGTGFFTFLAAYGALRFTVEFFRGDDRGALLGAGLSPSQWVSLFAAAAATAALLRRGLREPDPGGRSIYL